MIDRRVLTSTDMKNLLLCLLTLIHVSCVTQYPRKVEYSFKEQYPTVKAKLASHHYSLVRKFTIFQDEIKVSVVETVPNREFTVEKIMWAPDGGTISLYCGVLTPAKGGTRFVVTENKGPRMNYDGPRYITGDKLGPMEPLDKWLASNFTIKKRIVGEDRSGPPLYKGLD